MAFWVTAGAFISAKKSLDIHSSADASERLSVVFTPFVEWARERLAPLKEKYELPSSRGVEPPEIAQRFKGLFSH